MRKIKLKKFLAVFLMIMFFFQINSSLVFATENESSNLIQEAKWISGQGEKIYRFTPSKSEEFTLYFKGSIYIEMMDSSGDIIHKNYVGETVEESDLIRKKLKAEFNAGETYEIKIIPKEDRPYRFIIKDDAPETPTDDLVLSINDELILSWSVIKNATEYKIMRKIDASNYEELASLTGNTYTDTMADLYGGYQYYVTASNDTGVITYSNIVEIMVDESGPLVINDYKTDTDNDGLTDYQEKKYTKTDINNTDTDRDGLSDGIEVVILTTNPLEEDTDDNGITDDQEDFDNDGISNLDEINAGTDPLLEDTDFDGLTDFEEGELSTDPLKEDTDEDGILDGDEIDRGFDPLNPDTNNNGILDGDETVNVVLDAAPGEADSNATPRLIMDIKGKELGKVSISNLRESNPYLNEDLPGYVGAPFEFSAPFEFERVKLVYTFDLSLLNDPTFDPAIYYFNEETKLIELLPNQIVDLNLGTVTVELTHFSTYILLDKSKVDEVWQREFKEPFEGELTNIEVVLGFAIDSSGSMNWNDPNDLRKDTAKTFVDKMDENDKAAIIDFDSYAKVNCELTSDKETIKNAIELIDSNGGTNLAEGVRVSLDTLEISQSKAKFIILLTDGEGYYNHSLTQEAIEKGVKIYTIGLGNSVDESLLRRIAEDTGGKYYHASTAEDLSEVFEETSQDTIDLTTDTDGDGLSNYHEKNGVLADNNWVYTDWQVKDTDGDDIPDGQEVVFTSRFHMISNPNLHDSDFDGIGDKEDPEPMSYNITDRTLALAAALSYTNLNKRVGDDIKRIHDDSYKIKTIEEEDLKALYSWEVIYANDSGMVNEAIDWMNPFKVYDKGLGSCAIKISRQGKPDAIIFAIRGTEMKLEPDTDIVNDLFITDKEGAMSLKTPQSKFAFREYKKLINNEKYKNAEFYITGHSLGGRIVQDVLYDIYNGNDGTFGFGKKDYKTPVRSVTFNSLGFNKPVYWSKENDVLDSISSKLYNYYYKNDLVGEGLGDSWLFKRMGTNIGPWTVKDENDKPLVEDNAFGYRIALLHDINHFIKDFKMTYPGVYIID